MKDEDSVVLLVRIDERTKAMDEKLDDQAKSIRDHEKRLQSSENFRSKLVGYGSALGISSGGLAALVTKWLSSGGQ